jgi:hypothetical protein
MPIFGEKRARGEWCQAGRRAHRGTGLESRPFYKCSHCDVLICCNKKRNCFIEFHDENYFDTDAVSDEPIYSTTDDSSAEDDDLWIPRPLSLPSEDPTEGRVGYFIDQEYREGNVEEED